MKQLLYLLILLGTGFSLLSCDDSSNSNTNTNLTPCASQDECSDGKLCHENVCVWPCLLDDDCPGDGCCAQGVCVLDKTACGQGSPCDGATCSGHGTCTVHNETAVCECETGFAHPELDGDTFVDRCLPVCGDSLVSEGEACDDGNTVNGDYCSADCRAISGNCGDGQVQSNEVCDDGINNGSHCMPGCQALPTETCGDGIVTGNEACDDGNTVDGDYCSADCRTISGNCGDGQVQSNEVCDDGINDGSHCMPGCQALAAEYCGDGIVTGNEVCDDGNNDPFDFCAADCMHPGPLTHVYILAGQSNMDGIAALSDLTDGVTYFPLENVTLYWYSNQTLTPLTPASNVSGRFGPELGFARAMSQAHPGERIALIKYAVGGTNLQTDWHPGNNASSPKGAQYTTLIDTIESGLGAISIGSGYPVIEGFLWMQGESDSADLQMATAYQANVMRFIRRLREDLQNPVMPFVIGGISNTPFLMFRNIVRSGQNTTARLLPNTEMVGTEDLGLIDMDIHYDAPSVITLGQRFAQALLAMASEPQEAEPGPLEFLTYRAPESTSYEMVYSLPLCNDCRYTTLSDVQNDYLFDASSQLAGSEFDRIAYLMVLEDATFGRTFSWVSMDAFTSDLYEISVPVEVSWQHNVSKVSVVSDHPNVETAYASDGGNMEFWNDNYAFSSGPGDTKYDCQDVISSGSAEKYGSMQIHNNCSTVIAFNNWGASTTPRTSCLGMGNNPAQNDPGQHPDWTMADNWNDYTYKNLYVFIQPSHLSQVPESQDYTRIYSIDIPVWANWDTISDIPYTMNRSLELSGNSFDRVAYYLELRGPDGDYWIWTSMDAFTSSLDQIGVPVSPPYDVAVTNLTVRSNHPSITDTTNAAGGSIEFWSHTYTEGLDTLYDHDDVMTLSAGYGSMQVHLNSTTQWAFNAWSSGGYYASDIGIGPQPQNHPDWTMARNAGDYVIRKLQVFVRFN